MIVNKFLEFDHAEMYGKPNSLISKGTNWVSFLTSVKSVYLKSED